MDLTGAVFIDTSAIYAILDRSDQNHASARDAWLRLLDADLSLFTTNYVLVESCALAQSRLGIEAVKAIQEEIAPAIGIDWIDEAAHSLASAVLLSARRRKLSLVDCASFGAMRRAGARVAFAFDRHFAEEGFVFPG
jgi:predicted nucleic acid-binding protein